MRVDAAEFVPGAAATLAASGGGFGTKGLSPNAAPFVPGGATASSGAAAASAEEAPPAGCGEEWPPLLQGRPPGQRRGGGGRGRGPGTAGAGRPNGARVGGEEVPFGGAGSPAVAVAAAEVIASQLPGAADMAATGAYMGDGAYEHHMGEVAAPYYYEDPACGMEFAVPVDEESFLTPAPLPAGSADEAGLGAQSGFRSAIGSGGESELRVEGRRLLWEVGAGQDGAAEALAGIPPGECVESPAFWVAGLALRLALYPAGASIDEEGSSSVALLSEEKAKLKFELFLNGRSSGRKVMLGKKYACDFRRPASLVGGADPATMVVGVEVHENLLYAGFFY